MKKMLFLLPFIFLFAAAETGSADENLLKNGSFEDINGSLPNMWSTDIYGNDYASVRFFVENKGAYDGVKYVTIQNIRPNDAKIIQTVKVKPNTIYKLSCAIKAEGIGKNALGANITVLYILETSKDFKDTNGKWEYVELYGRTGKKQDNIVVTARLGGYGNVNTGKASFDNFRVEQVDSPPVGVKVINLYREDDALQQKSLETRSSALATILDSLLFLGLLFTAYYSVFMVNKETDPQRLTNGTWEHAPFTKPEQTHFSKTDYILMWFLTTIYAVIALVNLGSLKAPQSFWKPANRGERFYADIGVSQNISRINYFLGLGAGSYKIDFSEDSQTWRNEKLIEQKNAYEMVEWRYFDVNDNARYVRITVEKPGAMLNEIGLFNPGSTKPIPIKSIVKTSEISTVSWCGKPENVFDEQQTVAYVPAFINSMYFDEVYHARTAYEHLHRIEPTETSHPPLGKVIISLGIAVFGMTPFGWRIMSVLFGIAMVPAIYYFGKRLFKRTDCAFIASFLLTFDFMHFSYTRIGSIDVFAVFFIIMMYYYMYQYFSINFYNVGLVRTFIPLLLSGVFFGLGMATKWITVFGGIGLAVILFTSLGQRFCEYVKARKVLRLQAYTMASRQIKENKAIVKSFFRYAALTLLWCILTFVVIPIIIYLLSYIPFMMVPGPGHSLPDVLRIQRHMYEYHSKLQTTHPFSSAWWEWPVIRKPLWLYMGKDIPPGKISSIVAMGNPAIWWLGLPAIITAVFTSVYKKEKGMYVVLVGVVSQYLLWIIAPRKLLFIYHFFPTVPFMILCIVYVLMKLMDKVPRFKYVVYAYLIVVVILFVMFYPILSGTVVSRSYAATYLKWFNSWIFF